MRFRFSPLLLFVYIMTCSLLHCKAHSQQASLNREAPLLQREEETEVDIPLEKQIGQKLFFGFEGSSHTDPGVQEILQWVRKGEIGGVLLMDRNIQSPQQLKHLTNALQHAAEEGGNPVLFIGISQEGGALSPLSFKKGFHGFVSAQELGDQFNIAAVKLHYEEMAFELNQFGFNVNFAPVLDLALGPPYSPLAKEGRMVGNHPVHVAYFGELLCRSHQKYGIVTVAKHYPGYGSSSKDPSKTILDVTTTWRQEEEKPYKLLSAQKDTLQSVLVGHVLDKSVDSQIASLSFQHVAYLRHLVGPHALLFADDLHAQALAKRPEEEVIPLALAAGIDTFLLSNTGKRKTNPAKIFTIVNNALRSKKSHTFRVSLRHSYVRIHLLKTWVPVVPK